MRTTLAALVCGGLIAACSPQAPAAGDAAPAVAAGERFYDRETFTIVYTLSGVQTGSKTEHVREWGRLRAEVMAATLSILGVQQDMRSRSVMRGAEIFSINEATGEVTRTENPLYAEVTGAMRGRTGVEFGAELMRRMGGTETGETGSFAGQTCRYWTIMGARSCVTDWGATLHLRTEQGGFLIEQTATEVRIGDGGPDAAFAVDASKAKTVAIPDLGGLANQLDGALGGIGDIDPATGE